MPYDVNVDRGDKIVLVRIWDAATPEEHHAARLEAVDLCVKQKYQKMLVDLRDLKTDKISSRREPFEFGEAVGYDIVPVGVKIAHVMPTNGNAWETVHFVVMVEKDCGGLVEEFDACDEAKQWLLSPAAPQGQE